MLLICCASLCMSCECTQIPSDKFLLTVATLCAQGLTGFLKRSTHEEHFSDSAELKVGMLVEVAVTSVVDRRVAHVTTEPTAVLGSVVKDWDGLDIGAFWK